jgi:hypothetical protein
MVFEKNSDCHSVTPRTAPEKDSFVIFAEEKTIKYMIYSRYRIMGKIIREI